MKALSIQTKSIVKRVLVTVLIATGALTGCTAVNPKAVQLQLPSEPPEMRTTSFSEALTQLGTLSQIYSSRLMKIQCREITDVTGTSWHTEGEIPASVTVMVKSALNAVGGQVVYIPYWPDYVNGIRVSGYPVSENKLVPEVILTGGITEFDRGLVTTDRSRNFDVESKSIDGVGSDMPGDKIGLDYEKGDKRTKAKIAVDFNLISYEALCGIPRMQASNGINVYKGVTEEEFGITLLGPTVGLRGNVKKVQGRHDALRLLVQFSVVQLVGRYLDLPYWKLIDGAEPDSVVIESIKSEYVKKDRLARVLSLQRLLWLHGHEVPINGKMDSATKAALAQVEPGYDGQRDSVSVDQYLNIYLSVPIGPQSIVNRNRFDRRLAQLRAAASNKPNDKPSPAPKTEPDETKEKKTPQAGEKNQSQANEKDPGWKSAAATKATDKPAPESNAESGVTKEKTTAQASEKKQSQTNEKDPGLAVKDTAQAKRGALRETSMDIQSRDTLERIIQRLDEKRKSRLSGQL